MREVRWCEKGHSGLGRLAWRAWSIRRTRCTTHPPQHKSPSLLYSALEPPSQSEHAECLRPSPARARAVHLRPVKLLCLSYLSFAVWPPMSRGSHLPSSSAAPGSAFPALSQSMLVYCLFVCLCACVCLFVRLMRAWTVPRNFSYIHLQSLHWFNYDFSVFFTHMLVFCITTEVDS